MAGDFSRVTFAPERHFAAVLFQQGRVQLDADLNEHTGILRHLLRTLAADLVGPWGAPADAAGFEIALALDSQNRIEDLTVSPGRFYVGGILCENEALDADDQPREVSYFHQPDAHFDPDDDPLPQLPFLVYLRVRERDITVIEDLSLREVALGDNGPDTAIRAKVVWQVLVTGTIPGTDDPLGDLNADDIRTSWAGWQEAALGQRPRLRARAKRPPTADTDPCVTDPEARYRGPENQLYRVEIHTGGTEGDATFKWSRENASVAVPIRNLSGKIVHVASLGRDGRLSIERGDFVEVVDDRYVLRGRPLDLVRVKDVDPLELRVELWDDPPAGVGDDTELHPLLRRWDHRQRPASAGTGTLADDNALEVVATTDGDDNWIELEDGVQVQFASGGDYRTGDHWLIRASTATGDVEWPRSGDDPAFRRPAGITSASAPLALVHGIQTGQLDDLRCVFDRLACPPNP